MVKDGSCVKLTNIIFSSWVEAIFIAIMVSLIIFGSTILKILLACFLILLLLRELIEASVSIKRYVASFENWAEIGLVIIVSILLVNDETKFELNRHLARDERLLQTRTLIGQEIQLRSSCPIRARELYLLSNQSTRL